MSGVRSLSFYRAPGRNQHLGEAPSFALIGVRTGRDSSDRSDWSDSTDGSAGVDGLLGAWARTPRTADGADGSDWSDSADGSVRTDCSENGFGRLGRTDSADGADWSDSAQIRLIGQLGRPGLVRQLGIEGIGLCPKDLPAGPGDLR